MTNLPPFHPLYDQNLKNELKKSIKEGDTVFTICRKVSRSGMYRHISVVVLRDGSPLHISSDVASLLDYPFKQKTHAVGVSGCGMADQRG